ncbi:MAG TPA: hypothetical protein PK970_01985 [Hyphomicrobiaceae bacterium]|nr:hypothetical protein [Hyphomicrobiaceae bacterium]
MSFAPFRILALAAASAIALPLAACTHEGFGSLEGHYATFSLPEPSGRTVHVCHAYGCRQKTRFRFTDADIAELSAIMAKWRTKADTPEEERRGVAYAVGWIENRVGTAIGTATDRAGMDFAASGDPTQQDCVDEATNTTSYLRVLADAGLLRHHTVDIPFAKENYLRGISGWTHWTAVLKERASPQKWAVDSWIYANGENPAVERTEEWYISSLDELPKPKR